MDNPVLENLESLGFTQMEARVYCTLVTGGEQSGYQIARTLNATRSSVYPALDALYQKGAVLLLPGEINIYQAISPESVIRRLKNGYLEQADAAIEAFAAMERGPLGERYANVAGKSNLVARAIDLIDGADTEIVMNLSLEFSLFADSLRAAAKRGVRIMLFSWTEHDTLDVPLEFYCPRDPEAICLEERILIVTDATRCLIGSNDRSALIPHHPAEGSKKLPAGENDFLGMASDNRLMVNIILEHIHLDIYLLKLKAKYGQDLVDSSIQLGSLMEKGVL